MTVALLQRREATPADIAGLVRWYAADEIAGAHGDLLSTWVDKSGNAADLTSSGSDRPSLVTDRWNGRKGLLFSGAQKLTNDSATGRPTQNLTVFAVASMFRQGTNPKIVSWAVTTGKGFLLTYRDNAANFAYPPAFIMTRTGGGNDIIVSDQAAQYPSRGAPQILMGWRDGTTAKVRADGTETSGASAAVDVDYGAGTPLLTIGYRDSDAGTLRGIVHEVLVFNVALSAGDIAKIETYLDNKWRVTPDKARFIGAYNGYQVGGPGYSIGVSFSPDGRHFKRHTSNPVLIPDGSTWEDTYVKDPFVVWDGTQWVMYYAGLDDLVTGKYRIGRATSPDGITWTRYGSNPVIDLGSSGAFDDDSCNFPSVIYDATAPAGRQWRMWYTGIKAADSKFRIGHAYSSDGITWTKHGQVLDVGGASAWDEKRILNGCVVKVAGTFYLFYGGMPDSGPPGWQGGLATFTDPEGTYTKHGSNPLITKRSGTSQDLTADTAAAARVVTVADTSSWAAHEAMYLADGDSESEYVRLLTIDSATQATVEMPTRAGFTTAQTAKIRSAHINSVIPRSIRQTAAGWEIYGTPFQPVQDFTPGGSQLREMSFAWTATALTGPWSYDHDRGLLFEHEDHTTRWDHLSAENPCVAAYPGRL